MSEKKSSSAIWPRVPPAAAGIQINHCKNPLCANFGIPPKPEPSNPRGRRPKGMELVPPGPGDYIVSHTTRGGRVGTPGFRCCLCDEIIPMQSNLAVAEELLRISAYLEHPAGPKCPNVACGHHDVPITTEPANYVRYGTNSQGAPRYRCNDCRKVFSVSAKATNRQRVTHTNRDIFEHLVNTVPIRRVIKLLKITPGVLYRRIDFIWRQCQLFAGERERGLLERKVLGTRYLATDRQALMVNWSNRRDRRNTLLWSIATADLASGYVFATNLNYDPDLELETVAKDAVRYGDFKHSRAFRRYARVWLPEDFDGSVPGYDTKKRKIADAAFGERLDLTIESKYEVAQAREDIEAGEGPGKTIRTPVRGMQIHEQVSMVAHIELVARLLRNAEKIRVYMDQESGIRAAFMAAYKERVMARTADAWYVQVLKEGTVGEKNQAVKRAQERLAQAQIANPHMSEDDVVVMLAREEMARMAMHGKWKDKWLTHPLPDMREPEKKVCWLTDIDTPPMPDPEDDANAATLKKARAEDMLNHAARLYLKASLHGVDKFFMQIRRGLTMAERGVVTAASDGRWFGKNAYNPAILVKLIEIFRVYYNYCEVGDDKQTPAMRLGLAKGPVASEDILYFVRENPNCKTKG